MQLHFFQHVQFLHIPLKLIDNSTGLSWVINGVCSQPYPAAAISSWQVTKNNYTFITGLECEWYNNAALVYAWQFMIHQYGETIDSQSLPVSDMYQHIMLVQLLLFWQGLVVQIIMSVRNIVTLFTFKRHSCFYSYIIFLSELPKYVTVRGICQGLPNSNAIKVQCCVASWECMAVW